MYSRTGEMIALVYGPKPYVYSLASPFAQLALAGVRRIEIQGLDVCKSLTGRIIAIHASGGVIRGWDALIAPEFSTVVQRFMDGKGTIGALTREESAGNIIGLAVFGQIHQVTEEAIKSTTWVKHMPKYPFYIDLTAMISLHTPIPHKGDPGGAKRGLSLFAAVSLHAALTEGQYTLQYGSYESFASRSLSKARKHSADRVRNGFGT